MKTVAVLIVIAAVIPGRAHALDGNGWRGLSETARDGYISGVVDTWRNLRTMSDAVAPDAPGMKALFTPLRCIKDGMTYSQIHAIVEKYMKENPDKWHYSMASNVWAAIDAICK